MVEGFVPPFGLQGHGLWRQAKRGKKIVPDVATPELGALIGADSHVVAAETGGPGIDKAAVVREIRAREALEREEAAADDGMAVAGFDPGILAAQVDDHAHVAKDLREMAPERVVGGAVGQLEEAFGGQHDARRARAGDFGGQRVEEWGQVGGRVPGHAKRGKGEGVMGMVRPGACFGNEQALFQKRGAGAVQHVLDRGGAGLVHADMKEEVGPCHAEMSCTASR